ncbi:hypothetical protein AXJ18_gp044 [Streptomyces phage Jay2Jay]|uniref:Uncharacterized protein n=3 Tax=Samistivirus TaxID=2560220 RepID=A0A0A0RMI4_9CAUD|nr:hypothetical protein AXJ18_gp022 [Streptomyces phage Jay2Jay]YP_009225957.1 hypothetical protein AXJ18_gp044 [Streptomyces phage Jay2Jay]ASN73097.1 hypothetical protein SEA_WARPY_22 [Streptomyces phage Warpy]AIW02521.1 hypothetical protein PBI_JAY2JAY_22 [Streptomyces phage Jay2Jay]AIW02730.1 hypothetical protein PBI_JAY2JAY_277 [Streptomyces phage Jay2Jay]ASN73304.1 hypothetical protein SEA_WARPY_274 [Streptomyces phage Warpy]
MGPSGPCPPRTKNLRLKNQTLGLRLKNPSCRLELTKTEDRMCFHKWSDWKQMVGTFDSPLFPRLGTWKALIQVRQCSKCGKVQRKDI